ncbi:MAG: ribose 5-phosphate isomerase B [Halarsenatibacteraceae bacterium]
MQIAIGSDHAGFNMKEDIKAWLLDEGYQVKDFGTDSEDSVDYPDFAEKTAKNVASGDSEVGILICGTGIGMAISANKVKGVRAARCQDSYSARMARAHNNANVLTFGSRVIGIELAKDVVATYLNSNYAGGRHQRRVGKIDKLEKEMTE